MALDYSIIGERLKRARLAKNMTQENLAEKIDVSEGYILSGSSENSESYLEEDFKKLLEKCSPEKQKLIYNIAKTIAEDEN